MAVSFVAVSTASLPSGTQNGDRVYAAAYRDGGSAIVLPADWTLVIEKTNASPFLLVAYRDYDGTWTLPTFTNAGRTVAATFRPTAGFVFRNNGGAATNSASSSSITYPTVTMAVTNGSSALMRGVVHNRADTTISTPTGHSSIDVNGTRPAYGTFTRMSQAASGTATSSVSRSAAYASFTIEIAEQTAPTGFSGSLALGGENDAVFQGPPPPPGTYRIKVTYTYDSATSATTAQTSLNNMLANYPSVLGNCARSDATVAMDVLAPDEATAEAIRSEMASAWGVGTRFGGKASVTRVGIN